MTDNVLWMTSDPGRNDPLGHKSHRQSGHEDIHGESRGEQQSTRKYSGDLIQANNKVHVNIRGI